MSYENCLCVFFLPNSVLIWDNKTDYNFLNVSNDYLTYQMYSQ